MNRNKYFFSLFTGCRKNSVFRKNEKPPESTEKRIFHLQEKDTKETPYAQEKIPGDARNTSLRGDFYSLDSLYYGYCILFIYIHTYIREFSEKKRNRSKSCDENNLSENGAKAQMKSFPTKGRFQNESYI